MSGTLFTAEYCAEEGKRCQPVNRTSRTRILYCVRAFWNDEELILAAYSSFTTSASEFDETDMEVERSEDE